CRHRPQSAAFRVEVRTKISVQTLAGPVAYVHIDRREFTRHRSVAEPRKRVDRPELIPATGNQGATEIGIKEVLATYGDGQSLVRLGGQRFLLARLAGRVLAHTLSRSFGE